MNICISRAIKNRATKRYGKTFVKTIAQMRCKAAKVLKDGMARRAEMLAHCAEVNQTTKPKKRVYKPRVKKVTATKE